MCAKLRVKKGGGANTELRTSKRNERSRLAVYVDYIIRFEFYRSEKELRERNRKDNREIGIVL